MPGPSRKTKAKRSKTATPSSSSTYIVEIDKAEGWNVIITILCTYFELPDLTSRSGLKRIHANFEGIYGRIDEVYQANLNNEKIRGGIIGLYAKMCVDSILRNKLFDKGLLEILMPLLNIDSTRRLALCALATVTHHGGVSVRMEISKQANVLTKLIRDFPDDPKIAELGVTTIAHSVTSVVEGGSTPASPEILEMLDIVDILRTVIETVKKLYRRPQSTIEHGVAVVAMATMHCANAFKTYPAAIRFLVAGMRSQDWVCRCTCLGGIIRLHHFEAEDDQRMLHPNQFMDALRRGVPSHLGDIMMNYGPTRCEIYMTLNCSKDFQNAMIVCTQDKNLYSLGLKLAALILKTEFSVGDGMFEVEDPVTKQKSFDDMGLPFKTYAESLPICARVIREKNKPDELDLADILDIKYLMMKQRLPEAIGLAKKSLQRNPKQAYFYYVITLSVDNVQGLRAAKQGMKCKIITPFVRFQMMQRAVEHAADMGIKILQDAPDEGNNKWEEGVAFLMSALEDAKTYIEQAPPDNRHMMSVSYWFILLSVAIKDNLGPDLRELQDAITKLNFAEQFSEFTGFIPPKTNLRLAQQTVVKHYSAAVKEFSNVYLELDKAKTESAPTVDHEKLEDDLDTWLNDMHLEDGTIEQTLRCGSEQTLKINFEHVTLYRCSWCGNPSAVLRKCSRCSKTRYCDANCQKSHWIDHKKVCKT